MITSHLIPANEVIYKFKHTLPDKDRGAYETLILLLESHKVEFMVFGSRAYGFEGPHSDLDFICAPGERIAL